MPSRQVFRSTRVVTPTGIQPAVIHVEKGRITDVTAYEVVPADVAMTDCGQLVIMPGLVDAHVHVNEPGRTHWEGFETATRAAAAGGVTTLVDMPLNSIPPTTTRQALKTKKAAADKHVWVDVAFWGGAVPGNLKDLEALFAAGVCGVKCFLVPSGIDEFGFLTARELPPFMREIARLDGMLLVHAELPGPIEAAARELVDADPRRYKTFLASRPRSAENEAVALVARLCEETGCRTHVVHLSSSDAIETVRYARKHGPFSAETCPHYLTLDAEDIPDGATTFKCCPPVREHFNREHLWEAVKKGTIASIVSDHSPSPPDLKALQEGDFMAAWGGISSVQLSLPNVWTEARQRGATLVDLARWMCAAPAQQAGLSTKGAIAVGKDADLAVFDPDETFQVAPGGLHYRHPLSPYVGRTFSGVVKSTFLRGEPVFADGQFQGPRGQLLRRG